MKPVNHTAFINLFNNGRALFMADCVLLTLADGNATTIGWTNADINMTMEIDSGGIITCYPTKRPARAVLQLYGPSYVMAPGGWSYYAWGGVPGYAWSVSSVSGVSIDPETGFVTLDDTATGSFDVTVTDIHGTAITITSIIANS